MGWLPNQAEEMVFMSAYNASEFQHGASPPFGTRISGTRGCTDPVPPGAEPGMI